MAGEEGEDRRTLEKLTQSLNGIRKVVAQALQEASESLMWGPRMGSKATSGLLNAFLPRLSGAAMLYEEAYERLKLKTTWQFERHLADLQKAPKTKSAVERLKDAESDWDSYLDALTRGSASVYGVGPPGWSGGGGLFSDSESDANAGRTADGELVDLRPHYKKGFGMRDPFVAEKAATKVKVGDLFKADGRKATLLVLLTHVKSDGCRDHLAELRDRAADFAKAPCKMVLICTWSEYIAKKYMRDVGLSSRDFQIICDPYNTVHNLFRVEADCRKAFGIATMKAAAERGIKLKEGRVTVVTSSSRDGSKNSGRTESTSSKDSSTGSGSKRSNFDNYTPDDVLLMGGDFLVDAQGKVLMRHPSRHAYDFASADEILAALPKSP